MGWLLFLIIALDFLRGIQGFGNLSVHEISQNYHKRSVSYFFFVKGEINSHAMWLLKLTIDHSGLL